jgi:ADP-ribose pyrophosphatase YjhB (NUDIX family)
MKTSYCAGGIVVRKNKVALVRNKGGKSWSFPKGNMEKGEDELAAAKREVYEETGILDLKLVKLLGTIKRHRINDDGIGEDKGEMKVMTLFLFRTDQESLEPVDTDNPEARWVSKSEVADLLTHEKDKKFFLSIIEEV